MSNDIKAGDMVARVMESDVPNDPKYDGTAYPPLNHPVLCIEASNGNYQGLPVQGLKIAGWPVRNDGWWCGAHFRKVPPADLIEEPRRKRAPVPA